MGFKAYWMRIPIALSVLIIGATAGCTRVLHRGSSSNLPPTSSAPAEEKIASMHSLLHLFFDDNEPFNRDFPHPPLSTPIPLGDNAWHACASGEDCKEFASYAGNSSRADTFDHMQSGSIEGVAISTKGIFTALNGWSEVHRQGYNLNPDGSPGASFGPFKWLGVLPNLGTLQGVAANDRFTYYIGSVQNMRTLVGGNDPLEGNAFNPAHTRRWVGIQRLDPTSPIYSEGFPAGVDPRFPNCVNQSWFSYAYRPCATFLRIFDDEAFTATPDPKRPGEFLYNLRPGYVQPQLSAIAASNNYVVVSQTVPAPARLLVYDAQSMDKLREIAVVNPTSLAIIETEQSEPVGVVLSERQVSYFKLKDGSRLGKIEFPSNAPPVALASHKNLLAVATGALDRRIYFFRQISDGNFTSVGVFGAPGGFSAAPKPGLLTAKKLGIPLALAFDETRLLISFQPQSMGSLLNAYEIQKTFDYSKEVSGIDLIPTWRNENAELIGSGLITGESCDRLFTNRSFYRRDPEAREVGTEWAHVAETMDRDLFPEDYRRPAHGASPTKYLKLYDRVAKIYREFLTFGDQWGWNLAFFQTQPDSYLLKPATLIGNYKLPYANLGTNNLYGELGLNIVYPGENGRILKESLAVREVFPPLNDGKDMQEAAAGWKISELGTIVIPGASVPQVILLPLEGFDRFGNPKYSFSSRKLIPVEDCFNVPGALYDEKNDTLYVSCFKSKQEMDDQLWGTMAFEFRKIAFATDAVKRVEVWRKSLLRPETSTFYTVLKSWDLVGDVIFAGLLQPAETHLLYAVSAKTGETLGTLARDRAQNGAFYDGWIDSIVGVQACYDKNRGLYRVASELLTGGVEIHDVRFSSE